MNEEYPKKIIIITSGGADSATLLYKYVKEGYEVKALSFNYGQRHSKELDYARLTCKKLKVQHKVVDLKSINSLLQGSALTSKDIDVPEGHYAADNMKITVVSNRNMIMLSLATAYAVSLGYNYIAFGAHFGDHQIYEDCREEFVEALNKTTMIANYVPVKILAPFLNMSKTDVFKLGLELGVDFSNTWSCYGGRKRPDLVCGTCVERTQSFYENNTTDPLLTKKEWDTAVKYMLEVTKNDKK